MKTDAAHPAGRVSAVIPVLNAEAQLPALLAALDAQRPAPPDEIVLVDSLSTDATRTVGRAHPRVRIVPVARFAHGRARNLGVREAAGDVIVMLTQDALPADDRWLAALLEPLADSSVAAVYSRQVPRADAPPTERFFLQYHFPPGPPVRRSRPESGPVTFPDAFFSNVSSAARRAVLLEHPFDESLIMSEDQQVARDLLNAGLSIVYQPASVVIHSHRYTLGTAFRRYFDSIYSLTLIYPSQTLRLSAAMGRRYLLREVAYVARRHPAALPYYALYNLAKAAGAVAGHFCGRLPRSVARAFSLHRYHWDPAPADP